MSLGSDKPPPGELARARAGLYALAARLAAKEPDAYLLKELNQPSFKKSAEALGLAPPPMPPKEDLESFLEGLATEYARLFLLPRAPLHPYESVQRGEERLWGEATVEVQQAYHEAGFELDSKAHQIPDHLAVELEFMATLSAQEAERWEEGSIEKANEIKSRQEKFLRQHLGVWVPGFARQLREESHSPYYKFVAGLLETIM